MEQENVYRLWNLDLTYFEQSDAARLALIKTYFCPTRRAPAVSRGDVVDNAGQSFPPAAGCEGDYGVCAGNSLPPDAIWSTVNANGAIIRGTGRNKPGFGSQTRIASITDGVSNTIFVGEKHITPDAVLTRADPSILQWRQPGIHFPLGRSGPTDRTGADAEAPSGIRQLAPRHLSVRHGRRPSHRTARRH
jgi:hypothetical protein